MPPHTPNLTLVPTRCPPPVSLTAFRRLPATHRAHTSTPSPAPLTAAWWDCGRQCCGVHHRRADKPPPWLEPDRGSTRRASWMLRAAVRVLPGCARLALGWKERGKDGY
eukprot:280051-Chlamydomonas_euryale.AAC.2